MNLIKFKNQYFNFNNTEQVLDVFEADTLTFKEFVENYPTSSGDKIYYYFSESINISIVFFGNESYLQSISIFKKGIPLTLNNLRVQVGDSISSLKASFPVSYKNYEESENQKFYLNIQTENFNMRGNILIETQDELINNIIFGFLE